MPYLCPMEHPSALVPKAISFLHQFYQELSLEGLEARIQEVEKEIHETGTYTHTAEELTHGARMAWRNSNRCLGRLFWKSLIVQDKRSISSADDVFEALVDHLDQATNKGKILPTITIFAPKQQQVSIRIWNHQLIAYAGYQDEAGTIIGDPKNIGITRECIKYGWTPKYGRFDLLPLLIQVNNEPPVLFEIPVDKVLEVAIKHPESPLFETLGLRWYAVPVISDMVLEIGGILYPAAPFNGWYMVTEIGSRNLGDKQRYNMLPAIAEGLQMETNKQNPLWKDKALVLLNEAVFHSFQEKGVTIVDHHTAAEQFMKFMRNEGNEGRGVTADWTWIVPPMAGSAMELFHLSMDNTINNPNFYYNNPAYERQVADNKCPFHVNSL